MMKHLLILLALAGCASSDENTITLTDEQAMSCHMEGGCALITKKALSGLDKSGEGCIDESKRTESFNPKGMT